MSTAASTATDEHQLALKNGYGAGKENLEEENQPTGPRSHKDETVTPTTTTTTPITTTLANFLSEALALKSNANALFAAGQYDNALRKYNDAVALYPCNPDLVESSSYYHCAVLHANIAACHVKLEQWEDAVRHATTAIDNLDRRERRGGTDDKDLPESQDAKDANIRKSSSQHGHDDIAEEIVSAGAMRAGPDPASSGTSPQQQQPSTSDVQRIRAKALMRRAHGRRELSGWANLEGAIEDYKQLSTMHNVGSFDLKMVQSQLRILPPLAKAAQEKETAEMWAKLKDLGNGLLKPFGLSTDNFQMIKDEKTGGYSMNFANSPGGGSSK